MSERSNVSISEILGDNYYIDKLTSNDYSPSVGDTVTITLLVNDVFGDPVTGQTRTVTCTSGQFVSVNGTSITASSSVDVTTSSSGTVTLGLSVSVADNIIVSDGREDCVVCSISDSIITTESTTINPSNVSGANIMNFTLLGDKLVKLSWIDNSVTCSSSSVGTSIVLGTLPEKYRPTTQIWFSQTYSLNLDKGRQTSLCIMPNGQVLLYCWWTGSNQAIPCIFTNVYALF